MYKIILAALLLVGCGQRSVSHTTAIIYGVSPNHGRRQSITHVIDEHGHGGNIRGIWGEPKDVINVRCINNGYYIRIGGQ